jgi:cyclase
MKRARIIPILLIKDKGLVKSVKFDSPKYVGDPLNAVRIFNEKEVDELIVLDISASREGRAPNKGLISKLTEECFMPLCYGGGVTTIEQMEELFAIGVEKISINSGMLKDLSLISRAAKIFGSQSIVASIDCKRTLFGSQSAFSHSGLKILEKDPVQLARRVADAGAGEILVNSVDRDGTREGFDLSLVRSVVDAVSVPVIAAGGGGEFGHFRSVLNESGASAAAGGSFFVFQGKHRAVLITYPSADDITALRAVK